MKLFVRKEKIGESLQRMGGMIPARTGAAYLRSIWLDAKNGALSLMINDGNTEFTGRYEAEITSEGLSGVSGKVFTDLIKQLPSGDMELTEDDKGGNLVIKQGKKGRYKLPVTQAEWFQPFAVFPEETGILWSGDILLDIIDRVSFCIDNDETKDGLSCLCLLPREDGNIWACGINGYKCAIFSFRNDDLFPLLPGDGLLIQKKFLSDIKKWLPNDEITFSVSDKRVFLKGREGSETISVPRALSYTFPDCDVFLSRLDVENPDILEIDREEFIRMLKILLVFASDTGMAVINMELSSSTLSLYVNGSESGEANEGLDVNYSGNLKKISFSARDLLDIFTRFRSQKIRMQFTGPEGVCGITGDEDSDYKVVTMPVRTDNDTYYNEN